MSLQKFQMTSADWTVIGSSRWTSLWVFWVSWPSSTLCMCTCTAGVRRPRDTEHPLTFIHPVYVYLYCWGLTSDLFPMLSVTGYFFFTKLQETKYNGKKYVSKLWVLVVHIASWPCVCVCVIWAEHIRKPPPSPHSSCVLLLDLAARSRTLSENITHSFSARPLLVVYWHLLLKPNTVCTVMLDYSGKNTCDNSFIEYISVSVDVIKNILLTFPSFQIIS